MKIKVKQINGETTEHEVDDTSSVLDFKAILASLLDVEVERQRLIYAGRVLKNEDALITYGVVDNCTLHLVVKPQNTPLPAPAPSSVPAAAPTVAPGANRQIFNVPLDTGNMVVGSFHLDGSQNADDLSRVIDEMIQSAAQQAQVQQGTNNPPRTPHIRVGRRGQAAMSSQFTQAITNSLGFLRTIVPTPLLTEAALTSSSPHIILSRLLIDTSTAINHVQNLLHPLSLRLTSGTNTIHEEAQLHQSLHQTSSALSTLSNISYFVSSALQQLAPRAPVPQNAPQTVRDQAPPSASESSTHPATIQPSPGPSVSPARPPAPPAAAPINTPTNPQQPSTPAASSDAATALPSSNAQLPPGTAIRIDIPNLAELGGQLPPAIAQLISGLSGVPPAAAGNAVQGLLQNMLRTAGSASTAAFNAPTTQATRTETSNTAAATAATTTSQYSAEVAPPSSAGVENILDIPPLLSDTDDSDSD